MKGLFLSILVMAGIALSGQSDSVEVKNRTRPSYPHMERQTYLEAEVRLQAFSNQLSILQIRDLIQDDFLDQAEKDQLTGSFTGAIRYGYFQEASFTYRRPPREIFDQVTPGQGFRLRNTFMQSALLDQNTLNLILYGNKPYEDQSLDIGKAASETWYYTSLDYLFDVRVDTIQSVEFSVGFVLGHDHNSYKLGQSSIYTAPLGEYLDADLRYGVRDLSRESSIMNGLGLSMGVASEIKLTDNQFLKLEAADVGIIYWNRGYILEVDSTFRFNGAGFDNILNITDSITNGLSDQYREAFFYQGEDHYVTMLPFFARAEYRLHRKRVLQDIRIGLDYRYLPGYLPRFYTGVNFLLGRNALLQTELSTGAYNLVRLDVGCKFRMGYSWEGIVAIYNLNGLVMPGEPGGAGLQLRLRYRL